MLVIDNISFAYGTKKRGFHVFKDLTMSFTTGFNVIIGPNGAGKSTLLKSIFGLLKHEGTIWYEEQNLTSMSTEKRTELIAYLPQMDTASSMLTVMEMVLLGRLPSLGRKVKDEDLKSVMETLTTLNIAHLAPRHFCELSGGQKKTVFIAQTLVRKPKILLLDEPVNSLDLQKQLELCHLLKLLSKDTIIIVVLHDLNLAARFASNIGVLDNNGKLYGIGTAKEMITKEMLNKVYGVIASVSHDSDGKPVISVKKSARTTVPA